MRRLLLIPAPAALALLSILVSSACQSDASRRTRTEIDGGSTGGSACPADPAGDCSTDGQFCTYGDADGGVPTRCTCALGTWRCDDCPWDLPGDDGSCTPGQGCSMEDWEHGCSCLCDQEGRWQCTPETIGSHCPSYEDAGP